MKLLCFILVSTVLSSSWSEAKIIVVSDQDRLVNGMARSAERALSRLPCDSTAVRFRQVLSDSGYLAAMVSCDTSGGLEVDAGKRYTLGNISTTGDTVSSISVNMPFTQSVVDDAFGRIVAGLQELGFYYAQATISSVRVESDTVHLTANVRRGPLLTVGDLLTEGLVRNSSVTVSRYLRVESGTPITAGLLAGIETRARQISFLSFESPITVVPRPGFNQADLKLRFREPSAVSLQGNAGFRPDDRNGLIWSFDGTLRDILGDGRRVRLRTERRDKNNTSLAIDYRQPIFLLGRSELQAGLRTRDYRDQFSEFAIETGLSSQVGDRSTLGSTFEWSRVDPASGLAPGYSRYLARLSFAHSAIVDTANPAAGSRVRWSVSYLHRQYRISTDSGAGRPPSVNETRSKLSAEKYQRLGLRKLIGLAAVNLMLVTTPEESPGLSELFLLGGPGTIRGYRTDQFAAIRAAIGTAELRWRGASGYLFLFSDLAYLVQPVLDGTLDEFTKVGYGAGFNLVDRDRAVMLAFAWNPDLKLTRPQLMLRVTTGL